jgi:hypothetical protein
MKSDILGRKEVLYSFLSRFSLQGCGVGGVVVVQRS